MHETSTGERRFNARTRTMQLIASLLLMGVLVFLGIVLFLVHRAGQGLARRPDKPIVSYTALALLPCVLAAWYYLPTRLARHQVRKIAEGTWALPTPPSRRAGNQGLPLTAFRTDTDKLLAVFQTTILIGSALPEGAAFLGCIAYLLEAQPFALGVVGVAVLLMLVTFPTRGRIRRWLEEQQGRIGDIRQSQGLPVAPPDPVDAEINKLKERITELERQKQERGNESL